MGIDEVGINLKVNPLSEHQVFLTAGPGSTSGSAPLSSNNLDSSSSSLIAIPKEMRKYLPGKSVVNTETYLRINCSSSPLTH